MKKKNLFFFFFQSATDTVCVRSTKLKKKIELKYFSFLSSFRIHNFFFVHQKCQKFCVVRKIVLLWTLIKFSFFECENVWLILFVSIKREANEIGKSFTRKNNKERNRTFNNVNKKNNIKKTIKVKDSMFKVFNTHIVWKLFWLFPFGKSFERMMICSDIKIGIYN